LNHSIGISDSYYRATETELLDDYLKAREHLTFNIEEKLKKEVNRLESHISNINAVEFQLQVKTNEIERMKQMYEEMNSTIQSILSALSNVNQSSKNQIAKRLIEKGMYK